MSPHGVAILGSTGSIGTTALRVLDRHRERFAVRALTAHANTAMLRAQERAWTPSFVALVEGDGDAPAHWRRGPAALVEAATRPDVRVVLNAIVGAAGLDATLAALGAGKRVALANKESLVVGGELVAAASRQGGGEVVPVDSEHSAILQCLAGRHTADVRKLIITASGGPFREWPDDRIRTATVQDALHHPTWAMGRKITVDSATLANKALEVIEAHFLFGLGYDQIDVVVHPQSIVHSMVEFRDGSVLAQIGVPSMELPILYALSHPERFDDAAIPAFDAVAAGRLTFEPVRHDAFPSLGLGVAAGRAGGAAPAVFNGANEQAVALFLEGRVSFGAIAEGVEAALDRCSGLAGGTLDALWHADAEARRTVRERLGCR
ncbi:MAG TPA: 1-deoxy-D-xylulose-5-phosphate reductoisomerase [Gemmatimonadaceae bacterium]|jgi:1-deoxy-D-xylulose-5-phosphate reductoisomerase